MQKYLLIFLVWFAPVLAIVNADQDVQFWQYNGFRKPIGKNDALKFAAEWRFGDCGKRCYFIYAEAHYLHKFAKYLDLSAGYRQVWTTVLSANENFKPIYVPMLDAHLAFSKWGWEVNNRNRVEYNIFEQVQNRWVYRNLVRVFLPLKLGSLTYQPFIDDEIFFFERRGFVQNRLSVGTKIVFGKKVYAHFFYMLRHIEFPLEWRRQHIFGNRMFFSF